MLRNAALTLCARQSRSFSALLLQDGKMPVHIGLCWLIPALLHNEALLCVESFARQIEGAVKKHF